MNARIDFPQPPTPVQEFEASAAVQALVHDAALKLGATPEQSREAARTGLFELENHRVGVVPNADEDTLLLSIELGDAYFADPARARAGLIANMNLFVKAGVVFARGLRGSVLVGRWPATDADYLANGVRQMGALAQGFGVPSTSEATDSLSTPVAAVEALQE
ncbi:hypothetical protein M4R22_21545 [Acidovorax sp. GBBC 3334]|uniref:hypothetical protein n=1 Tax=unclassified Acidovorax TaxID=2684926 RepID=UPI00230323D2|nr:MULTISPECIES: hypothetical protein [unclassified Acidovorax]MDA8457353.1 hypothetical protein [Acidovorax sp. GBBC 3334]MDA8522824.1 hypothetical protein [Acidovorax sp. NCPPB 4044]